MARWSELSAEIRADSSSSELEAEAAVVVLVMAADEQEESSLGRATERSPASCCCW